MTESRSFECQSCGAALRVEGEETQVKCPYCGRANTVPENLRAKHPEQPEGVQIVINVPEGLPEALRERVEAAKAGTPVVQPRRRSSGCTGVLFLLIVALFVGAYGVLQVQQKGESTPEISTPVPTVAAIVRPLQATLPRTLRYANLEISVTGAAISNQTPAQSGETRQYVSDRAWAYIDIAALNTLVKPAYLELSYIRVKLSDGKLYEEARGYADSFDPQASKAEHLVFAVPTSSTWTGAVLVVAQAGKEPAELPLTGPVPSPQYPVVLAAGGKVTVQLIDFEILAAALDLDANGGRADVGQRFLILTLRMTNHNPAAGGTGVNSNSFRLIVDGIPEAALDAPIDLIAQEAAIERSITFALPASAKQIQFQVGDVGSGKTAIIPISLKAATP